MELSPITKKIVAIAPMVDITDIYFRCLCRILSKRVTLYTEMISAKGVLSSK